MPRPMTSRQKEIARFHLLLDHLHSPRLHMSLIVALTGLGGFFASFGLMHAGLEAMWLRYPLAVGIAYLVFLFFLWCWLRLRGDDFVDVVDVPGTSAEVAQCGNGSFGGGGSSLDLDGGSSSASWDSKSSGGFDADAGDLDLGGLAIAAILFAMAALIGALWAVGALVWGAPMLLAELLVDVALATGLYRRMRGVTGQYWLKTAIERTARRFAWIALAFALAGGALQLYAPGAISMGQVMQHHRHNAVPARSDVR